MSGKRCGVCGGSYRKGALLWTVKDGRMVQVRACPGCHSGAVILAVSEGKALCACGDPATTCAACMARDIAHAKQEGPGLKDAIKRLEGMVKAQASNEAMDEWREGAEAAITLLKSGRF